MNTQNWSWLALNFEWIGSVAAVIILILLFATSSLRRDLNVSKWKDFTWLGWFGTMLYLFHNVEEYGMDIYGRKDAFPNQIYDMLHAMDPHSNGPDSSYFLAVNITAIWVMGPISAILSKRRPFTGLAIYSIIFINIFFHLMPSISTGTYNPGFVTTILFFIPISIWLIAKGLGTGVYKKRAILYIFLGGIIFHIILTVPMFMALKINIDSRLVALTQVLNAVILLVFFLWADKKLSTLTK